MRLFVALDLPVEDRERVTAWRDELVRRREQLRPVAAASLHVTLVFLGHRPADEVEAIAASAFDPLAALAPVLLVPRAVVGVPARRPRLYALDLLDPGGEAAALQSAVSDALERSGHHRPERRPFWPHVTLARVKPGRRSGSLDSPVPPGPFVARRVTLYRSILRPQGALYEPLARARLARPGPDFEPVS